jgi:hypothetical protein
LDFYSPHAQAFEKSEVRQWNLSFDCLTSVAARARLRNLKETDPEFWKELTSSENLVPSENDPQPEDIVDPEENLVEDDSNVPLGVLIQQLTEKKVRKGFTINDMGALVADSEAERFEGTSETVDGGDDNVDKELGRGKRQKHPNQLYNNNTFFWCHDDDNGDTNEN